MEPWRERGFVPDSDEEDVFDSQNSKRSSKDDRAEDHLAPGDGGEGASVGDSTEASKDGGQKDGVVSSENDNSDRLGGVVSKRSVVKSGHDVDKYNLSDKETGQDHRGNTVKPQRNIVDEEEKPEAHATHTDGAGHPSTSPDLPPIPDANLPSTPLAKQPIDIFEFPSSSPDVLQLNHHISNDSVPTGEGGNSRKELLGANGDSSPLSSPPSSLDLLRSSPYGDKAAVQRSNNDLEKLLPPLEVDEDILRELDQPMRRSLRERNPIQLHPYLLEDARYRRLMQAGGVKPVQVFKRLPDGTRTLADDSEGQESVNAVNSPPSSSVMDFQFPPSSPPVRTVIRQRQRHLTPRRQTGQDTLPAYNPTAARVPRAKRRKLLYQEDNGNGQQWEHSPRHPVVITHTASPEEVENDSIWDIPPTPNRRGSSSSTQSTHFSGFRFPRGFTPPAMTTPITEPTPKVENTENVDELQSMDLSDAQDGQDPIVVDSTSSESEPSLDAEDEPGGSEAILKQLQRRIKGVLPASWLRLDLKQQVKRTKSSQRNRDTAFPHRPENVKGVARKITKTNSRALQSPRRHTQTRLLDFDNDSQEEEDGTDDAISKRDWQRELTTAVRFDEPFHDEALDDDIPEDNRIDNMFPPVPRGTTSLSGERQGVKRRKPQKHGTSVAGPWKRPRMKRQSRITDSTRGGWKPRWSSPKPPGLGILDAPDVAEKPRQEQPQFIRIAARKARSRRDRGRHSPTRKFVSLSSKRDTEDANASLREWRRGAILQAKPADARPTPGVRQPLIDLSTNTQDVSESIDPQESGANAPRDSVPPLPADKDINRKVASHLDIPAQTQIARVSVTDRTPHVHHEQRGNKWVIRRNFAVSSLKRNVLRSAEPEVGDIGGTSIALPSLFKQSLSLLNQDYCRPKGFQRHNYSLTLDRFLSDNIPLEVASSWPATSINGSRESNNAARTQAESQTQKLRKRPPKRLDLNADVANYEQALEISSHRDSEPSSFAQSESARPDHRPRELTSFQLSYTHDFKIVPLRAGTFFHESTFVGSGEFARSLDVLARDLDKNAGVSIIEVRDLSLRWGSWNDAVSSELGMAFEVIADCVEKSSHTSMQANPDIHVRQACTIYESLIKYVTHTLYFIDHVDRIGFVERVLGLVWGLKERLTEYAPNAGDNRGCFVKIACYNLIFSNQARQIASYDLVNLAIASEALEAIKVTSRQLIGHVVSQAGLKDIQQFLEDNKHPKHREVGIHASNFSVEAYVVARHVLHSTDELKVYFEASIADTISDYTGYLTSPTDVLRLENGWHGIFSTLPLNEIDQFGITRIGSRFRERHDNWSTVKRLLCPVLDSYNANPSRQPISFNNYCRALFYRCFNLVNCWGWRDCKFILETLFDFFAKNGLYNLNHEEAFGSPVFLEELDREPSLETRPGEPCFHIFLKIVGSGLRFLSKTYNEKKIRNFAWRLLPNHGRVYPKEKPLRHEDLDALRNHHDLLCTLYWAVPEACRPRLEAIRNLVHPASSHRETCNISLRSWSRLVRFKLSTGENVSELDPFADWHGYFMVELLKQHSLARTEVETQSNIDSLFSRKMIESTISQNQRQIESLLNTALEGLKTAIQLAPNLEHARILVSKLPIKAVLGLFNPKIARLNNVVLEALQIILSYLEKDSSSASPGAQVLIDEDSQEYGDWSAIEAIYGNEPSLSSPGVDHIEKVFHPAISRLVSDCFGEDHCPDDAILLGAVDCWTSVAHVLVKHGLRYWDSYVSDYDANSWLMLRGTVQTRKFTPQFLASCIGRDAGFLSECKAQVLCMWISSLVERSSMLKFQHVLTEALLNHDPENPLFKDLPFLRDRRSGRITVSLQDLSQRRLSLISSLLSNMRKHLEEIEDAEGLREFLRMKQEYKEFVERLMRSMKANYQELGGPAETAQGAYVDFVQCVVGFLQQHARDIVPIDPFFTDPTTFPLPSTDPTYIVARLKSYEPKLCVEKVVRTLIIFIQGVSERAAIDGQQVYLVDQLCASMADTYEGGNPSRPTLRATFLQCIFPAYVETTFRSAAAWILSRPILQTISLAFKDLLFNMDTTDPSCVQSVTNIIYSIFQAIYQALHFITDDSGLLKEPTVLLIASSFMEMMTCALPVIDYIDRIANVGQRVISQIQAFQQFALFTMSQLGIKFTEAKCENFSLAQHSDAFFKLDTRTGTAPAFFQEARHLASRELQAYVHENWSRHEDKYYFTRRGCHQPQEVEIDPSFALRLEGSPETDFKNSVGVFLATVEDLGFVREDD